MLWINLLLSIGGVIWLWPTGVFETTFAQLTLGVVGKLIACVLLALWGLANLYNRLGPKYVDFVSRTPRDTPDERK